jgi:hypothetical protein
LIRPQRVRAQPFSLFFSDQPNDQSEAPSKEWKRSGERYALNVDDETVGVRAFAY